MCGASGKVLPILILCCGLVCFAQSTATIVGAVKDSSGAVVPDATVTATNTQTGFETSRKTDAGGEFKLPLLPVGTYNLSIEKPGFQRYTQSAIKLAVNDNATVDATLAIGGVTQA